MVLVISQRRLEKWVHNAGMIPGLLVILLCCEDELWWLLFSDGQKNIKLKDFFLGWYL